MARRREDLTDHEDRKPKAKRAWARTTLTGALLALAWAGAAPARAGEVVEYYHLDAVGNVRAVTNQAGQVTERHDYLPFGEECVTGSCAGNVTLPGDQPKRFTGKERDEETGLDYFGARYYGSKPGRFTSPDPISHPAQSRAGLGAYLSEPQRWNRYAYATNNPLRYVDPNGLEKFLVVYVQQPRPGSSDSWAMSGGSVDVGHTFIGLKDTDTGGEVRAGFYPGEGVNPIAGPIEVAGVVQDDSTHAFNVRREYSISDQAFAAAASSIDRDRAAPPRYNLNSRNCTGWALEKAQQAA